MKGLKVGYALCGSFCTFSQTIPVMEELVKMGAKVIPIMSQAASETDTRFGSAKDICGKIKSITGMEIIKTIATAEPIGPQKLLDVMVIAPCTGNTLTKLALGITDTPVTMAAKAHLRNGRPLVIAVATNDGLGVSAKNIGLLMNAQNVYFVPFGQDDCDGKPKSLIARFDKIPEAIGAAAEGKQIQPLLIQ